MKLTHLVLVLFGLFSHSLATLDKIADIIHDVVHTPSSPVDHRQTYYPQAGPYVQDGVYNRPYVVVTGNQHNIHQSPGSYYPQTGIYYPPPRTQYYPPPRTQYYPPPRTQYYPPNSYGVGTEANVYGRQDGYYQGAHPTYQQNGNGHNYNSNGHRRHPPQQRNYNYNGYQSAPPPPPQNRHGNSVISLNVVI